MPLKVCFLQAAAFCAHVGTIHFALGVAFTADLYLPWRQALLDEYCAEYEQRRQSRASNVFSDQFRTQCPYPLRGTGRMPPLSCLGGRGSAHWRGDHPYLTAENRLHFFFFSSVHPLNRLGSTRKVDLPPQNRGQKHRKTYAKNHRSRFMRRNRQIISVDLVRLATRGSISPF